jgi:CHASE2 domain-containing sensor protein
LSPDKLKVTPCQSDRSFQLLLTSHYLKQTANITTNNPFTDKNICTGIKFSNGVSLPNLQVLTGGYQVLRNADGCQILLNYRANQERAEVMFSTYDLESVLNGVPLESFRDRIILIGTARAESQDFWTTPFGGGSKAMSGVDLQAQMISQLLDIASGKFPALIWVLPQWGEALWILAWSLLGAGLGWWWRLPQRLIIAVSIGCVLLYISCVGVFIINGWLPLLSASLSLVTTSAAVWGWTFRRSLSDVPSAKTP